MTYGAGTMPSLPDLIARAHLRALLRQYDAAAADYVLAADMACGDTVVAELLRGAWICLERAAGRVSLLEVAC